MMREPPEQPAAKPTSDTKDAAKDSDVSSWTLLLSAPIMINMLFFMLLATANFGLQQFVVVALGALYDTPAVTANAALSGYLIMGAAGVLIGGWIASRTSRHGLVAMLGLTATSLSLALVGLVDLHAMVLITVLSLAGASSGAILPARDMIVRAVTPPGSFGKVFGFVTNGFNIGGIISPLIFGALMDHGEPRLLFLMLAGFWLLAVLAIASVPGRRAA